MRRAALSIVIGLAGACGDSSSGQVSAGSTGGSSGATTGGATAGPTTGEAPTTTGADGTSTSSGEGTTAAASTGPAGCAEPAPCDTCTCAGEAWACHCPLLSPEAGYLDVDGASYQLGPQGGAVELTSSPARLFYSFHPAEDDPGDAPLVVLFNGGPGVSTGVLLAGNTAPQALQDDLTAAINPTPWTAIGHLLYVDARNTGFSYQTIADPSDMTKRSMELQTRDFNSYLDAADFARALLRFWDERPELAGRRLVIVAESYGGIRASILLHMLLFPGVYGDGVSGKYQDPALASAVAERMAMRFADPSPANVGAELGNLVLVQPSLAGAAQATQAGLLFEAPGSIVQALADELGANYVTCAQQAPPCDPWANAIAFVEGYGRSRYDIEDDTAWLADLFARTRAGLSRRDTLAALLEVEPETVPGLPAADRPLAFRVRAPEDYMTDEAAGDLPDHLGALQAWDRYFLPFSAEALDAFRGPTATIAGVHPNDAHYGALFLHDLAYARVFVTDAARDLAIWGPSIGPTLLTFPAIVADVAQVADQPAGERPGELRVTFKPGAFAGEPDPGTRTIRMPRYDASHAVSYDRPAELRADVMAWLASGT